MGQAHPCSSWQLQPPPTPPAPSLTPSLQLPTSQPHFLVCIQQHTTARCALESIFFPSSFLARCISCTEPRVSCCSGTRAPACARAFCHSSASSATHCDVTGCNWRDARSQGRRRMFLAQIMKQHFKPSHKPMLGFHNRNLDLEGGPSPES